MKIIGKQKAAFTVEKGTIRRDVRGMRRGWVMFTDLFDHFTNFEYDKLVKLTVQRSPRGTYEVKQPTFGSTTWAMSFALDVYRNGNYVGRVCRRLFEKLYGPVGDGVRLSVKRRVLA